MISSTALELERDRALAAVGGVLSLLAWPRVPVRWNRRLRRAGRAVIERRGSVVAATIELSPAYFEVYPDDLGGILVHEAVHVGLALLRRDFGHGPAFRRACLSAGGRLHSRPMPGRVWQYRCPVCESTLERRRRPSGDRWCAPCAGTADRAGAPMFTADRALILVGMRFSAGDAAAAAPRPSPSVDRSAVDRSSVASSPVSSSSVNSSSVASSSVASSSVASSSVAGPSVARASPA